MNEITQYLNQLQVDKNTLVDNLVAKGVDAANDETFTTLVPKINNIPSGGSFTPNFVCFRDYKGATLGDMSNLDTSNIVSMSQMFYGCSNITELDVSHFKTDNVTDMGSMFLNCNKLTSLNLSNFKTSKVTRFIQMFTYCHALTEADLSSFDSAECNTTYRMFRECRSLKSVNLSSFVTTALTSCEEMFYGCTVLENLDISNFDMGALGAIKNMFYGCSNLTNLLLGTNLGKGFTTKTTNNSAYALTLSNSNLLTHDSLMNVINKLYDLNLTYDVANGGTLYTQQLVLGSTNMAKLTAEEIAIATNKGWTVS